MGWTENQVASSITERLERVVRQRAEHLAVDSTTYAGMGTLSDDYASLLHERGGKRAALLLDHGAPVLAGAIAALKCAMPVVALNATDPPARLHEIRESVTPDLLLTDRPHLELAQAAGFGAEQTLLVSDAAQHAREARAAGPGDVAFLICTSGSSGKPKVVMQSHRNILHNVLRYTNGLGIQPDDRIAWLAALSSGQGLVGAFTALLNGATLCSFPIAQRGLTGLADWLESERVTILDTIPSVFRSFAQTLRDRRVHSVRLVRLASEGALHSDFEAFNRHFETDSVLASVLASSEAGIMAQALLHPGDAVPEGRLTVGAAAPGIDLQLLREDGRPAKVGEVGEIVIEGDYLSLGYWNDPALTDERFSVQNGRRRLHSGDLACRWPDGRLTVLGRADKMVKIRGNRLQLEEVEAALAAQPELSGCAVAVDTSARGDVKLTAYVSARTGSYVSAGELRRRLGEQLPPFAIPSAFVFTEQLPLTPHGKIDRDRLRELDRADVEPATAPASEIEQLLLAVWAEAFEHEVRLDDAFLELGGDSLLAAVIAARVHELYAIELDLGVFAADIDVASMARLVEESCVDKASIDELPPLRRIGRVGPLSSSQARFWNSPSFDPAHPFWTVVVPFVIRGSLDVRAFRASVQEIVRRHESLRTTFTEIAGQPTAVVRPAGPIKLPIDDLRGDRETEARAQAIVESELRRSFDLQNGPLLRLRLLRMREDEYRLLRITHHLVHDALSWRVFFHELALIYGELRRGRPSPLPDRPQLQYLDFAVWERTSRRPDSARFQAEVAWWERLLTPPVPDLRLPFERAQPDRSAQAADGFANWGIPAEQGEALNSIGRAYGATHYMTRLAAFAALLALETRASDLVIGIPVSTRTTAELQKMIGLFLNFAVLRLRISESENFAALVREVRRSVVETSQRVWIPVEQLNAELLKRGVRPPNAPARFVAWATLGRMCFGGIEVEPLPRGCPAAAGFRLGVNRSYETERCWVEFDPQIYDRAEVLLFLKRLQALIAAVCANPEQPLDKLRTAIDIGD
jgi:non-ribosomal peptide synthetase component F